MLRARVNMLSRRVCRRLPQPVHNTLFSRMSATTLLTLERAQDVGVGSWLLLTAGVVASMVAVGGLTRLTKSGLSMVDWKVQGGLPPLTAEEWEKEFEKYKSFPEWQRSDQTMTVSGFKRIYIWEYGHRMLGRVTGLVFAVPFFYFLSRGRIHGKLARNLCGLFALGGTQGLIGWWMVKSGLQEGGNQTHLDLSRVSPYRLATHLGMALLLFSGLVWNGLSCLRNAPLYSRMVVDPRWKTAGRMATGTAFATALSGALVAGNEAGLVYNEWPRMGLGFIPSDLVDPYIQPFWRNAFENMTWCQFQHRCLAYTSITVVGGLAVAAQFAPFLPPPVKLAAGCAGAAVVGQATLGIFTLINYVPIHLASLHQIGSITVLGLSLWTTFELSI